MKRMVLMLGILAVLVLSSLGGMAFAADTSEQMRGLLDKAQEYADRKDSELLLKQAEKMSAFIEGRQGVLRLYVRRGELEQLEADLICLKAQARSGDTDVSILLAQIGFTADHIFEREKLTVKNLF